MASQARNQEQPHFVLMPLMAQGHMIPMIDMARLFAERGVMVSLVTTPYNASRFESCISRARDQSRLPISIVKIPFPSQEVGLPMESESLDTLPSRTLLRRFFKALSMLQEPLEKYLEDQKIKPWCIISDKALSWTSKTAQKFNIPRIVFHGMCCFSLLSSHNIKLHNAHTSVASDFEPFVVPGLPHRIEITKAQLPGAFVPQPDLDDFREKNKEAEAKCYGVVVNSFNALEHGCAEELEKVLDKKVWCIGPVYLCNKRNSDRISRGNKSSIDETQCLQWLESMEPRSVIYACLGSLCRLVPAQLMELGLGLEASGKPFIWVVKTCAEYEELEKWLVEERFEERIKGRGLLIKGWAPQVLILSSPAIGGFLTHCGWNSSIEGACSGVPMITWPLFAEQFLNEKMIVEVLKIGVRVGVEIPVRWGDEEKVGVLVKKDGVKRAIEALMDGGEEGEKRRNRAREIKEKGRRAMEKGGSSHSNISTLIKDVMELHEFTQNKGQKL
ncbi:PREDICTED: UDP-glycosyltransferase 73D1 [Fragaria vesca subsp. vesca]|uniref:UDP-glycosyltransferase 73D1 n=1 Tax=Fragaria vesca subsp. vesca TaxID=101020 RepID=UPI0002C30E26|nr:PREDICTED: UDP-glycosyltransferase 73D1 [Fragaria vesca subsp. vesca]